MESKVYFYDCASPIGRAPVLRIASPAVCEISSLLEDTTGAKGRCAISGQEKREWFRRGGRRRVRWIIEVKTDDEALHTNLLYLKERISPGESLQLVKNAVGVR